MKQILKAVLTMMCVVLMTTACRTSSHNTVERRTQSVERQREAKADTRTPEQKKAMLNLLTELKKKYPNAVIVGHNEFSNKACPCFDAAKEYKD